MQTHFQHGPQIVERFMARGPSSAVYPGLWDSSLVLATLAQPWGGLQARDFSGRNRHGDVVGGEWGYGVHRGGAFRAVEYKASDEAIVLPDSALNVPANAAFSVSAWCYRITGGRVVSRRHRTTGSNNQFFLFVSTVSGLAAAIIYDGAERKVTIATPITQWFHLAFTRQASGAMQIYCNGTAGVDSGSSTAAIASDLMPEIGRDNREFDGGRDGLSWNGMLADARIYSRSLSLPEIRTLAQHPLAAYETRINRYWMFTSGGVAPAPEWVAIPRYGLAAAGLPKYALPMAGSSTASTIALPTLSIVV